MREHISREQLTRVFQSESSKEETASIARHLLSGCERCRSLASMVVADLRRDDRIDPINLKTENLIFQDLLQMDYVRKTEEFLAPSLWAELEHIPQDRRIMRISNSPRFQTLALLRYILHLAKVKLKSDPKDAMPLAHLALVVAEAMAKADQYSEPIINVSRAEAYTTIGNVRRLLEEFELSARSLERAEYYLENGTGDVFAEAETKSIQASLLIDVGHFEEAVRIMKGVTRLYRESNEPQQEGKALVKMAMALRHSNPEEGIKVAEHAMSLINSDDTYLYACAVYLYIDCINLTGNNFLAYKLFSEHRALLTSLTSRRHLITVEFLAAQIAKGVGFRREADRLFIKVANDYHEAEMYQEMSMAQIQLMISLVETGRIRPALKVASLAISTLERLSLKADALAVWVYIRDAIQANAIEVVTLRQAEDKIRRGWKTTIVFP